MVRIKSEADAKLAYEESTSTVGRRYKAGVAAASWQGAAIEGQGLYEEQMAKDEILKRRQKGIEKTSDESWRKDSISKGGNVIAGRMKAASQKQIDGFRPYREVLANLDLPKRTSDPMTNLTSRAGAVVMALVKKKEELDG